MMEEIYNKNNPFLASIKERYSLCKPGSHKDTQHVVLDLKGSNINYEVGDSIAIFPQNDNFAVHQLLHILHASGAEIVKDRHDKEWTFLDFLASRANIVEINRKLLSEIALRQTNTDKKIFLESFLLESNKIALKEYLSSNHVTDLMHANQEVLFSPQEFSSILMPLLPRFYSIASSPKANEEEIHLTVALLKYACNGTVRTGVCTQYLCQIAPLNEAIVPVYIQRHHGFTLPHDDAPIIMVGPGTGIAPFRAFMQERSMRSVSGKSWLFFGECHQEFNFFYENFWNELVAHGKLRLDVAFSRDQEHKVYVQHRMLDRGKELFDWLENGGYFYVCGDAQRMAKDVEATLLQVIKQHGNFGDDTAKMYVKRLRTEKRYLRDVY